MSDACPIMITVRPYALESLSQLVYNYDSVICVTDENLFARYGGRIRSILGSAIEWVLVSDYQNGQIPAVKGGIVIGFGGGRSIDTAKLLAMENGLDWISVPTAASHDGIASDAASVSHDGFRYSKKCKLPIAVIADLHLISQSPPQLNLAGAGDILCKASSISEWKYAYETHNEPFNEDAYRITESALDSVIRDNHIETLIRAEIDAGRAMCIAGSSRPCSGTEHSISHAMDRRGHGLHGLQVAFATPLCLEYLNEAGYTKYSVEHIRNIMLERGLPLRMRDLSMNMELFLDDIHHGIELMRVRDRNSILQGVSDTELKEVISRLY